MIDPQSVILNYISARLDQALSSLAELDQTCPCCSSPDSWRLSLHEANLISTAYPYVLADSWDINPTIISSRIVDHLTDPDDYFSACKSEKGYINFYINTRVYFNLLPELNKWLGQPPKFAGSAAVELRLAKTCGEPELYRANYFFSAKKNLLQALGYQVEFSQTNTISCPPSVRMVINDKSYHFRVGRVNTMDQTWEQIVSYYSVSAIKYIMLNREISQPVTMEHSYLKLHISNPLYLLDYFLNEQINRPASTKKAVPGDRILFESIKYPYILKKSLTSPKFHALFIYLNQLTGLTFEYSLWQNCIEKISLYDLVKSIVKHGLHIIEYNY